MRTLLKLAPGRRGAKKLLEQYGDRLVCVRCRHDAATQRRRKTVERVAEEVAWKRRSAPPAPETPVFIRAGYGEENLREQIKPLGAKWDPARKLWALPFARVAALHLESRRVTATQKEGI